MDKISIPGILYGLLAALLFSILIFVYNSPGWSESPVSLLVIPAFFFFPLIGSRMRKDWSWNSQQLKIIGITIVVMICLIFLISIIFS